MALTEQEARKIAEEKVYVYMTWGAIKEACKEFGIKAVKSRHIMEQKLIEIKKVDGEVVRIDAKYYITFGCYDIAGGTDFRWH